MRAEQTVNDMAQEVLWRQAKDHAKRTGESLAEALEAVLQTPAGCQLSGLRDGPHAREEARNWQEALLWERALERLEGMATLDLMSRFSTEGNYSWLDDSIERLEGKESRVEYYTLLEADLASLRG
jgi:hypothetical protein